MKPFFYGLWTGESQFTGAIRGVLFSLVTAIGLGQIDIPDGAGWKFGVSLLSFIAGSMRGGQPNAPAETPKP